MGLKTAAFIPDAYMDLKCDWLAVVNVHIVGEGSWKWSQPCDTRWGARRLAKRRARKLKKAYERGDLVL